MLRPIITREIDTSEPSLRRILILQAFLPIDWPFSPRNLTVKTSQTMRPMPATTSPIHDMDPFPPTMTESMKGRYTITKMINPSRRAAPRRVPRSAN